MDNSQSGPLMREKERKTAKVNKNGVDKMLTVSFFYSHIFTNKIITVANYLYLLFVEQEVCCLEYSL